jgi:hypothetical protein
VSLELSDATAVGEGALNDAPDPSATTANAVTEPMATASDVFGVPEGAPVWWVAVSVGPEVARAQMTFGDGSTDQMSPVDGVAVLAHQIDPSVAASEDGPYVVRGTLRLFDSSGAVIRTVTFPAPTPPPTPVPFPLPVPGSGSGSGSGSAVPASPPSTVPATVTSPPASNRSVTACPAMVAPVNASAG